MTIAFIALILLSQHALAELNSAEASEAGAVACGAESGKVVTTTAQLQRLASLNIYGALLARAHHSWEEEDVYEARALLDRCPERLRAWEHHYLSSMLASNQIPLVKHEEGVAVISFSPDSLRMASGSFDGIVKLTLIDSRQTEVTFQAHESAVHAIEFFPDGKRVATAGADKFGRVWDAASGQKIVEYEARGDITKGFEDQGRGLSDLAVSSDGELLGYACAFVAAARVIRVEDGRDVGEWKTDALGVNCVAFSPDGRIFFTGDRSGHINGWNTADGDKVLDFQPYPDAAEVTELTVAQDGRFLVSGSRDADSIDVWEFPSGKNRFAINMHARYRCGLSLSPDGSQIATVDTDGFGDLALVRFWDTKSGAERGRLKGLITEPLCVEFSPDGKWVASAGHDLQVTLWKVKHQQQARTLADVKVNSPVHPHKQETALAQDVTYSADGQILAACYSRSSEVVLWEVESGRIAGTFKEAKAIVQKVTLSTDNQLVAAGDMHGWVYVWDRHSKESLMAVDGFLSDTPSTAVTNSHGREHRYHVTDIDFSPSGKRLIVSGNDGSVGVWDVSTQTMVFRIQAGDACVTATKYSDDGSTILTLNEDGVLDRWSAESGARLRSLRLCAESRLTCAAWSPDETWIVGAENYDRVCVWDTRSGDRLATFDAIRGHVFALHASPDGRRVASSGSDRLVRIWDVTEGIELLSLRGHEGPASALAFSPDGKALASGGAGGIKLWEARK